MKRLIHAAVLAAVASAGLATPLFAGSFGLFYWGRHRCTSGFCCQSWNAFSPLCCPCEGGCGTGCGMGCKHGSSHGCADGACGAYALPYHFYGHGHKHRLGLFHKRHCSSCDLDGCVGCGHKHRLFHRLFAKHHGTMIVGEGEGIDSGYPTVSAAGEPIHLEGQIQSTPLTAPAVAPTPAPAADKLLPAPTSERKQLLNGVQAASIDPRAAGMYYWQPVSYQTGYPVYPYAMPTMPMYGQGGYYPMPVYYPGYTMPPMAPMGY